MIRQACVEFQRFLRLSLVLSAISLWFGDASVQAQDLLGDNIAFSGGTLHLRPYVDPGSENRIISMTTQPGNSANTDLYVSMQQGSVYAVHEAVAECAVE